MLSDGGFGLARQFAIYNLVRPVTQVAYFFGLLYSKQHVGAPSPVTACETGLNDHLSSAHHGCPCRFSRLFFCLF